jgi:hypothetical protein
MIIGLTGKMGVGKSTAAEVIKHYVKSRLDKEVALVKFAQPLYDMQEYIYQRISSIYTRDTSFVKDRRLLQWLGTEWGRNSISKSLWCDLWEAEAAKQVEQGKVVICDDVRFENEAERFINPSTRLICITSNTTQDRIDTKAGLANHESEVGLENNLFISRHINNIGTKAEFEHEVLNTCVRIFGKE